MTTVYKFPVGHRVSHGAEYMDGVIKEQITSKCVYGSDLVGSVYDGTEPFYVILWDDGVTSNEYEDHITDLVK